MRLKKGTRVEVLNTEEGSIGVWCTAEIISGNGRNYYVKYNLNSGSDEVKVERVPRKAIRPCPPHVQAIDDWVPEITTLCGYSDMLWSSVAINFSSGFGKYGKTASGLSLERALGVALLRERGLLGHMSEIPASQMRKIAQFLSLTCYQKKRPSGNHL
ncbi:hypothetical protein CRG98_008451 [Punica granatum]|uniref:Agenet domain-containing protein n=1 Tax=Punica granatum TaxID=22663 RepID=A0A2I0KS85_PUNGR|nr:hypothetical protein CRG98_008451 [Punica granatum]